ncbi:MAG: T9SS type A sorting domain-containing protein [Bacteroidota bacterium]
MKNFNRLFLPISILCLSLWWSAPSLYGQASCLGANAQIDLITNDISARLPGAGNLWWDGSNSRYTVEASEDPSSQIGMLFAGGLWIGGFDPGGNLKLAANTYGAFSGRLDYWPGPLDDNGQTTRDNCANYDRFWRVTRNSIDALIADFEDNGVIDQDIPSELLEWPGRDNPYFESNVGFPFPDTGEEFAPFFDRNNDGIYDPAQGDVPSIKGADQAIWWVFNDGANIHTQSEGDPIRAQIHAMAYTYNSAAPPINRATFYDYTIINKSFETVDSTYVGLWVDPDLGCYRDDYIGCNPEKDLFYVYNQDAIDDSDECLPACGVPGFCESIPVVGIKILEGTTGINPATNEPVDNGLSSLTYYTNAAYTGNPNTSDPQQAIAFYNYLSGSWRDGRGMTRGGNGYDPASTDFTRYAFPDNPSDPDGWSMCSEELDGNDARAILGSGPFEFLPRSINQFTFAVYLRDEVVHPCPDLTDFFNDADLIQTFYDDIPATSTRDVASTIEGIQLAPHPLSDYTILSLDEGLLHQVELFSLNGQLLRNYANINAPQLRIERQDLPAGMYFYRLQNERGQWQGGKLLVQ